MSQLDSQELMRKIDALEQEAKPLEAEIRLLDILRPLLEAEGNGSNRRVVLAMEE